MSDRLSGRVAIVTGAGQGIGLAYAERFLREGAKVVIAEINEDRGRSGLGHLRAAGFHDDRVVLQRTDVTDERSAQECADRALAEFGQIDILMNNAALYADWDAADQSYRYLLEMMRVNLHGAWLMTRAAAPSMVGRGRGAVINQSSFAAYSYSDPAPGQPFAGLRSDAYRQSKWGVVGLTKFCAAQLGPHGVTVNCIAPGLIATEATRKQAPPEVRGALIAQQLLARELTPEDLTGTAVYFASDDGRWVTGQVIAVDGGKAMPA